MTISYFYMWSRRRENLISEHNFLVSEGKARLTNQFDDFEQLERDADAKSDQWLERMNAHFDPDRDDPGDFYDQANDERIGFLLALDDLGNSARLALISGMFHLWERSVRKWLTSNDGVGHWHRGDHLPAAIWREKFDGLFELFECCGLFPNGDAIRDKLDIYRLVVNTYKHGAGSDVALKTKRPDFFDQFDRLSQQDTLRSIKYIDYEDLYAKPAHIEELSEAIIAFWQAIPEHITDSELSTVPKWFEKAVRKDRENTLEGHNDR